MYSKHIVFSFFFTKYLAKKKLKTGGTNLAYKILGEYFIYQKYIQRQEHSIGDFLNFTINA